MSGGLGGCVVVFVGVVFSRSDCMVSVIGFVGDVVSSSDDDDSSSPEEVSSSDEVSPSSFSSS